MKNKLGEIAKKQMSYKFLSFLCLILLFACSLNAQEMQVGKRDHSLYTIISSENDTTQISTELNINEYKRFNFKRKDDFEQLPFHNQGQTFTRLGYDFANGSILPQMGFTAKHHDYKNASSVNYFRVPTPTSGLMYQSGMEQGQVLDAFVTVNTSKRINLSMAYKGLESEGKYRSSLSRNGNFTTTLSYQTPNQKYQARGHFSSYNYFNQENGGLTNTSLLFFESGNSDYLRRSRLDVNHTDADNLLEGKRVFFEHQFSLKDLSIFNTKKTDSAKIENTKDKLLIGHSIEYESKHYRFDKSSDNDVTSLYGSILDAKTSIQDHTHDKKLENRLYFLATSKKLGKLKAGLGATDYDYHYNNERAVNSLIIPKSLQGSSYDVKANWSKQWKDIIDLKARAKHLISGDFEGNELTVQAKISSKKLENIEFFASILDHAPNLNTLLHQSDYENFNWFNDFKNEQKKLFGIKLAKKSFGSLETSMSSVENYTYFNESQVPEQAANTLNYLKVKLNLPVDYRKFTLDSDVLYQHVFDDGSDFFRVPEFLIRSSFFFSDHVFEGDPMFLQTGITAKYFTKFKANSYNPVISEFYLQNFNEIGNYVLLDFFANAKIQDARIFLKVENLLAPLMSERNYFSAPLNPYRDLTIRFGLIWNFFI
jgi:hypothetical protein